MKQVRSFRTGDRVFVTGGYDYDPQWLGGREGYYGTLDTIQGASALVQLDEELMLEGGSWQDFGLGSVAALGTVEVARGRWLVLLQGWVGGTWTNPTGRLHVGLCATHPRLEDLPAGGGIGVWIESHAHMTLA